MRNSIAYILLVVCITAFNINTAHSFLIDLTDLDSSNSDSHSCILNNIYDDTYHWEQCSLCNKVINKNNHIKTSNNTLGNSCDDTNRIIITCTDCDYYDEKYAYLPHTGTNGEVHILEEGSLPIIEEHLAAYHESCKSAWQMGDSTWQTLDGRNIAPDEVLDIMPVNLITPRGVTSRVFVVDKFYYGENSSITYDINDNICTVHAIIELPESWRGQFQSSRTLECYYTDVYTYSVYGTNIVYNNGLVMCDFIFTLSDISEDRIDQILIEPFAWVNWRSNGILYQLYAGVPPQNIIRDAPDPVINKDDFNV